MDLPHMKKPYLNFATAPPMEAQAGEFVVLGRSGHLFTRNLEKEDKDFSMEKYHNGECDSYSYLYHENFSYYQL